MRIDKVNWITAYNCGKPKWHSFTHSLSWKGKFGVSTLSHKMCPRKQTTEPKLVILVSFFSGEVTSNTDTSYCIHILREVNAGPFFFLGHPVQTNSSIFPLETDVCYSFPCQNDGNCSFTLDGYECTCAAGFNGTNCENGKLVWRFQ